MKHAFSNVLLTITTHLLAYLYKYACKKLDLNGDGVISMDEIKEKLLEWRKEKHHGKSSKK